MFSFRRIPSRLFAILLLPFAATGIFAQNFRGGINGTVTDQSGAVVPGAKVVATANATSVTYTSNSSSAGDFSFTDMPLGAYDVVVTAAGFQTLKIEGVHVTAGGTYTIAAKLAVASVATVAEVNALAANVSLDTTTVNQTFLVSDQTIQNTPMNGRDFSQFAALTPGLSSYSLGGSGSINGTRINQINFQIEGTDNNDIWWGLISVNQSGVSSIAGSLMPMDAIDELSMVTTGSAETGHNPGGTLNLAVKSGTNTIHGSLYYYNRNELFAAQNPFAPPGSKKLEERSQNGGFSLGGPIIKDRSFAFGAFEWSNLFIANSSTSTEPTTAYQAAAQSLLTYYGVPVNPVSIRLLNNLWPASALTGPASPGNYFATFPLSGTNYNGVVKLDEDFNEKNHLSLKAFIGQGYQIAPDGSDLPNYQTKGPDRLMNHSLIYNYLFSPLLANQLSLGVSYFDIKFRDANTSYSPVALGFNTGVTNPNLSGAPNISISPPVAGSSITNLTGGNTGFDPIGPQTQSGRTDITGQVNDAISWVKGAHQMRFGGEYRKVQVDDYYQTNARGVFQFNGSQGPWSIPFAAPGTPLTGCQKLATQNQGKYAPGYDPNNPSSFDTNLFFLADFLAGCVSTSSIVQGNPIRTVEVNEFTLFSQDNYQVTKNLNFNYGVRYDYSGPLHDGTKDLTTFRPGAPNGLAVAGETASTLYQKFWGAVSPRIGFAFTPPARPDIVLRASFGLYFDSPYLIPFLNLHGTTNNGAVGVQDNPAGNNPVATATRNSYIVQDGVPIFPPLQDSLAGAGVVSVFSVDPKYRDPYTQNMSFTIEKSLGESALAQVGYVGTQSRHLTNVADINQAAQGSGGAQNTRPYYAQYPNYSVINQVQTRQNASYNSLQALIRSARWHGLTSQLSYVWSHFIDQGTGLIPYLPQNSFDPSAERGNSDDDQRDTLSGYFNYDIPGSSRLPARLSHGWQLNGLVRFNTGNPYTPVASTNTSGNGENADRADATGLNPYAGISHKIVNGVVQWFNPDAFVDPPAGQYGTIRRGQYFNPGYGDMDFSVVKTTAIYDRLSLQFRAEFFNLFNRTNLAPVGAPTAGDSGGQIGSTIGVFSAAPGIGPGEPFNTQFAVKILF